MSLSTCQPASEDQQYTMPLPRTVSCCESDWEENQKDIRNDWDEGCRETLKAWHAKSLVERESHGRYRARDQEVGQDVDAVPNQGFEAWYAVIGGRHSDILLGIIITESG